MSSTTPGDEKNQSDPLALIFIYILTYLEEELAQKGSYVEPFRLPHYILIFEFRYLTWAEVRGTCCINGFEQLNATIQHHGKNYTK